MRKLHRLLTLLGVGAAAVFAALLLPMSAAHAADDDPGIAPGFDGGPYETCDGAVCLVMGDYDLSQWQYNGIRPFFTQWLNDGQSYNVQVDQGDGTPVDAGSYDIKVSDTWTPLIASYTYTYGDFVPNADAPADLDLGWFGDLSGSTVYQMSYFDGAVTNLTINDVGPHDATYWVFSMPGYTNTMVTAAGRSADFVQWGDSDPVFLWNSLFHAGLDEAQVPDYVVPADPFASLDFDPGQYLSDALTTLF